jgi:hypothetical protein
MRKDRRAGEQESRRAESRKREDEAPGEDVPVSARKESSERGPGFLGLLLKESERHGESQGVWGCPGWPGCRVMVGPIVQQLLWGANRFYQSPVGNRPPLFDKSWANPFPT